VALRKAAATAEAAAAAFDPDRRPDGWARARCEQGLCALLGAELFGDPGLDAAAEAAFREARAGARGGLAAALADVGLAIVEGRQDLAKGDEDAAHRAIARFNSPISALDGLSRRSAAARPLAAEARLARADLLCGWGSRLKDGALINFAVEDAAAAAERLDAGYEPLTWARAEILRGQALVLWGEAVGDVDAVATGASALATALDHLTRDHSPLDWARTQIALAQALQALGEASADERAYEQAVTCYDRANLVLKDAPSTPLRGLAAGARAMCLARSAELSGDLGARPAPPGQALRGAHRHHRQGPRRACGGGHRPRRGARRLRGRGPALAERGGQRGAGASSQRPGQAAHGRLSASQPGLRLPSSPAAVGVLR
jgi:tetratricopeptide (TPR) repeat protein